MAMLRLLPIFLLASIISNAYAKDKITWGVGHQPPRVTFDGVDKLGGQGGIQQKLLSNGLSEYYQADYVAMNWARFITELKEERNVCSSFLFKTPEREKYMHFSLPWHIDLPHRIMMTKKTWIAKGKPETLSLRDLSQDHELKGVIAQERSYGTLDTIINSPDKPSNLTPIATRPTQSLSMLEKSRIDYTIEYPYFVNRIEEVIGIHTDDIVMVNIEESADYYFNYVSCPKTQWGRKVIERVNNLIQELRIKPSYLDVLKMIHTNDKDKALVERIYHQYFVSAE
jgi:uncharacterized protein (TIGR02285 family)